MEYSSAMDVPPFDVPGFELLNVAGSGGMASVWQARHRRTRAPVAIKILPPTTAPRLEALRRTEIHATAALDHSAVVQCLDTGTLDDGHTWLALEWCGGGTLEDVSDGDTLLDAVHQILRALGHAHARGILHRDLKPANILRDEAGSWKLADFGVAHIASSSDGASLVGTPWYLAPETLQREPPTPAADLFGLAAAVWHVVVGIPPFAMEQRSDTRWTPDYTALQRFAPRFPVSPRLESWLRALLSVDPQERPSSAAAAARLLDASWAPTLAADPGRPERPERPERRRPRPRTPPTARVRGRDQRLLDLGVALLPFREPPFVGRRQALQTCLTAMQEAITHGEPRVIALWGESGVGVSRFARHLLRRFSESGSGKTAEVVAGSGVMADRLSEVLGDAVSVPALRRWHGERPALLMIDAVHPEAEESGESDQHVLATLADDAHPLVWVVTSTSRPGALLDGLPPSMVVELPVHELPASDLHSIANALVPLRVELRHRLVEQAHGSPGILVESLLQWHASGRLIPREGGYGLGPVRDTTALFQRTSGQALLLVAALGGRIDVSDWQQACDRAGVTLDWDVVQDLTRSGRAWMREVSGRSVFGLHPGSGLDEAAERAVHREELVDLVDAMLAVIEPDDPRTGLLHLVANRPTEAFEAFAREASRAGPNERIASLGWARKALAAAARSPAPDPHLLWSARLVFLRGLKIVEEPDAVVEHFVRWRRFLPSARADQRADFWRKLALLDSQRGRQQRVRDHVERALANLGRADTIAADEHAGILQACAEALVNIGAIDEAEPLAVEALSIVTSEHDRAYSHLTLARVQSARDDIGGTITHVSEGLRCALNPSRVVVTLLGILGETLARSGDFQGAIRSFEEARRVTAGLDEPPEIMLEINLAALFLRREAWERAQALCARMDHDPRTWRSPMARTALALMASVASAGLAKWPQVEAWQRTFLERAEPGVSLADPDFRAFHAMASGLCADAPAAVKTLLTKMGDRLERDTVQR